MWPLFAVGANMLRNTVRYYKHCSLKVLNKIYMIALFLCLYSMPLKSYWRRTGWGHPETTRRSRLHPVLITALTINQPASYHDTLHVNSKFCVDHRHWLITYYQQPCCPSHFNQSFSTLLPSSSRKWKGSTPFYPSISS